MSNEPLVSAAWHTAEETVCLGCGIVLLEIPPEQIRRRVTKEDHERRIAAVKAHKCPTPALFFDDTGEAMTYVFKRGEKAPKMRCPVCLRAIAARRDEVEGRVLVDHKAVGILKSAKRWVTGWACVGSGKKPLPGVVIDIPEGM